MPRIDGPSSKSTTVSSVPQNRNYRVAQFLLLMSGINLQESIGLNFDKNNRFTGYNGFSCSSNSDFNNKPAYLIFSKRAEAIIEEHTYYDLCALAKVQHPDLGQNRIYREVLSRQISF